MQSLKQIKKQRLLFVIGLFLALFVFVNTLQYYRGALPDNYYSGFAWILSLLLLFLAFVSFSSLKEKKVDQWLLVVLLFITLIYLVSHLYGYSTAPWNNYGLFDDAAWDIYISKQRCFTSKVFEIIYYDEEIGRISRELLFHYYISILFRLFGYNMQTFNGGLIFLGFLTVLFTSLTVHRLTKSKWLTLAAGLMINFLPYHYTQIFMGHRYAICYPLLCISFYFAVRSVQDQSKLCAVGSGVFAGLTMESAIMGKQYLWALIAAGIFGILRLRRNKQSLKPYIPLVLLGFLGYAVATAPLYAYIFTHKDLYRIREANLIKEFLEKLKNEGFIVIYNNVKAMLDTVFAPYSTSRQFSNGFPLLTWYLFLFMILGIFSAMGRGLWLLPFVIGIAVVGNTVTICYDFRFLITAPFVSMLIPLGGNALLSHLGLPSLEEKEEVTLLKLPKNRFLRKPGRSQALTLLFCMVMLISPIRYLYSLLSNPHSQWFLQHRDLAVCRYIQDVVVGEEKPNIEMKADELNRSKPETNYDVFAGTSTSYAHIHTFLQPYDDRKILSLVGGSPMTYRSEEELRALILETLTGYEITDQDLVLVLEYIDKLDGVLTELIGTGYMKQNWEQLELEGEGFVMVTLRVENKDLPAFQEKVKELAQSTEN